MNMLSPHEDGLPQGIPISLTPKEKAKPSFTPYLHTGFLLIFGIIAGFALWTVFAPIQGAVIAPGTVVVEGKPKTIQHLDGGIVAEILVRDGDKVNVGDVLIRLDSTSLGANRDILSKRLDEAKALKARLHAERGEWNGIGWSQIFPADLRTPAIKTIIQDQTELFRTRRNAYLGEIDQLNNQIQQSIEQISGLNSQIHSNQQQLNIISKELEGQRELLKDGYVSQARILSLEREHAALSGQIASYKSDISRTKTMIGETEIKKLQVSRNMREQVLTDLRVKESEISDLNEQLITASDQLTHVDILAPVSGTVHNMSITTIGGIISPANPIMDIIPDTDRLVIESQLEPGSIDQVYVGQLTTVRLSAFNQRTTPEVNGIVKSMSANTLIDPVTGLPFYTVRIEIPAKELKRLDGLILVPGMPAEAFMQTDKRSALNYLLKPATDQLSRAFREE